MHVLENVYFVYICSIFSLHCFVQFAENKDIVLYCIGTGVSSTTKSWGNGIYL